MDATLDLHKAALDTEIEGVLAGAHDDMDIDSWVAFIQATLRKLVELIVPMILIFGSSSHSFVYVSTPRGPTRCTS